MKKTFDLTKSLARTQGNDPCWFAPIAPQDLELEARIVNNLRRGDIRVQFAQRLLARAAG